MEVLKILRKIIGDRGVKVKSIGSPAHSFVMKRRCDGGDVILAGRIYKGGVKLYESNDLMGENVKKRAVKISLNSLLRIYLSRDSAIVDNFLYRYNLSSVDMSTIYGVIYNGSKERRFNMSDKDVPLDELFYENMIFVKGLVYDVNFNKERDEINMVIRKE